MSFEVKVYQTYLKIDFEESESNLDSMLASNSQSTRVSDLKTLTLVF